MSDKMLYNDVKAEQSFLTLINATVSHELRNPLSSMVSQINHMKKYLRGLGRVIRHIKEDESLNSETIEKLESIHSGFQ